MESARACLTNTLRIPYASLTASLFQRALRPHLVLNVVPAAKLGANRQSEAPPVNKASVELVLEPELGQVPN